MSQSQYNVQGNGRELSDFSNDYRGARVIRVGQADIQGPQLAITNSSIQQVNIFQVQRPSRSRRDPSPSSSTVTGIHPERAPLRRPSPSTAGGRIAGPPVTQRRASTSTSATSFAPIEQRPTTTFPSERQARSSLVKPAGGPNSPPSSGGNRQGSVRTVARSVSPKNANGKDRDIAEAAPRDAQTLETRQIQSDRTFHPAEPTKSETFRPKSRRKQPPEAWADTASKFKPIQAGDSMLRQGDNMETVASSTSNAASAARWKPLPSQPFGLLQPELGSNTDSVIGARYEVNPKEFSECNFGDVAPRCLHPSTDPIIKPYMSLFLEGRLSKLIAFWSPQKLEIGDVIFLTKNGAPHVLFNATLTVTPEENSKKRFNFALPPGFKPIEKHKLPISSSAGEMVRDSDLEWNNTWSGFVPGIPAFEHSPSIALKTEPEDLPEGHNKALKKYRFGFSHRTVKEAPRAVSGAAMILPQGARHERIHQRAITHHLMEKLKQEAPSWIQHYHPLLWGHEDSYGPLIFVTETCVAPAIASFSCQIDKKLTSLEEFRVVSSRADKDGLTFNWVHSPQPGDTLFMWAPLQPRAGASPTVGQEVPIAFGGVILHFERSSLHPTAATSARSASTRFRSVFSTRSTFVKVKKLVTASMFSV